MSTSVEMNHIIIIGIIVTLAMLLGVFVSNCIELKAGRDIQRNVDTSRSDRSDCTKNVLW